MSNIKLSFDTKKLEQQLKKQQQEAKRQRDKATREAYRIDVAQSIVEKKPIIGDIKIMDRNSEEILKILLKMYEKEQSYEIQAFYEDIPEVYLDGLTQLLDTLQQYGMIFSHNEFIGGSFRFSLTPMALTYFKDKEKAIREEKEKQIAQNINIQNLTANGSNINFGTISNSTITVENLTSEVEKMIEEKGGEDKAELKDLLEEVKELCENIQINSPLPKRAKLMNKISNHLEKHGWFYGAVVQLIGTSVITAMQGLY